MDLRHVTTVAAFILVLLITTTNGTKIVMSDKKLSSCQVPVGALCFDIVDDGDDVMSSSTKKVFNDDPVVLETSSYALEMMMMTATAANTSVYTGKDVEIFVLDTGLTHTHDEFKSGRASAPLDAVMTGEQSQEDVYGHGTHVAGCAAGTKFGTAPDAHVVSVKVMTDSGGGSTSTVIRGISWALANAKRKGIVINMSLSTRTNGALNAAVDAATTAGAMVVVAAGNQGGSASDRSPASAETAITVGAVSQSGQPTSWSNSGPAVNLLAPGVKVPTARARTQSEIQTKSGTSMSSPLVAGAAAGYLEKHDYDPVKARADLLQNGPITQLAITQTRCDTYTVGDVIGDIKLPVRIITSNSSVTGHNYLVRFDNGSRFRSRRKSGKRKMVYVRREKPGSSRFRAVLKTDDTDYDVFMANTMANHTSVVVNGAELDSFDSDGHITITVTVGKVELCSQ